MRRKVVPNFPNTFILSRSFGTSSTVAFSLPFPFTVFAVTVANSSSSEADAFLERVAVRMLCLIEARRLNVRDELSWTSGGDADEHGGIGGIWGLMRWWDGILKVELEDGLVDGSTAVAAAISDDGEF